MLSPEEHDAALDAQREHEEEARKLGISPEELDARKLDELDRKIQEELATYYRTHTEPDTSED